MEENYIIGGISPEEYKKLRAVEKSLLKAAKDDFNEFNIKFWGPRIRNVRPSIDYISESGIVYMNFGSEEQPRLFRNPKDFSEAEKLVAFNMRYQIKKSLKKIREDS